MDIYEVVTLAGEKKKVSPRFYHKVLKERQQKGLPYKLTGRSGKAGNFQTFIFLPKDGQDE